MNVIRGILLGCVVSWSGLWCDSSFAQQVSVESDRAQAFVVREARMQAQRGRMGHYNGSLPGWLCGVGWSTHSPEAAVRQCCYWYGTKRPRGVRNFSRHRTRVFHVERGRNGWYACALFR